MIFVFHCLSLVPASRSMFYLLHVQGNLVIARQHVIINISSAEEHSELQPKILISLPGRGMSGLQREGPGCLDQAGHPTSCSIQGSELVILALGSKFLDITRQWRVCLCFQGSHSSLSQNSNIPHCFHSLSAFPAPWEKPNRNVSSGKYPQL